MRPGGARHRAGMSRVLVTGGGSGVGRAIAHALADAGIEVVVAGRREAPLAETAEGRPGIRGVTADVTDEASVAALFEAAGPVDMVVANAGEGKAAPFHRTSLELWNQTVAVNLTGVFLTFREGLKGMSEGGRLIAVASTASLKGDPYIAAYAAAKHGVLGLVRSLAREVAAKGITVNAICPGFIDTPMTDRSVEVIVERTGRTPEEARAELVSTNPAGRLVRPEEVAAAAVWLASPAAAMVNGHALALSGGEV